MEGLPGVALEKFPACFGSWKDREFFSPELRKIFLHFVGEFITVGLSRSSTGGYLRDVENVKDPRRFGSNPPGFYVLCDVFLDTFDQN